MAHSINSSLKTSDRARAACETLVLKGQWPSFGEVLALSGGRKALVREALNSFEKEAAEIIGKQLREEGMKESLSARLDESRRIIDELTKQLSETGKEGLAQLERLERFLLRQAAEGRDLENVGSKRELERTKALAQQRFLDIKRMERQLMDYQKLLKDHGIEDPY